MDTASHTKPSLIGLSRDALGDIFAGLGVPEKARRMRVSQLWTWLYARGARDFEPMTVLSKELRAALARRWSLARPGVVEEQVSADGTRKWLLRLPAGKPGAKAPEVETVYIPEAARGTLCISSQVGCTLTCSFCHTGTQRLVRNLTPGEIAGQIMVARDRLGDWPGGAADNPAGLPEAERKITNIVLMGMGEPLYNFDNVRDAMAIASASDGLAFSKRRITLSTSGVVPEIPRWGEEANTMLAISLHAVRDGLRDELVPVNRKWPIAELLDACRQYPSLSNARRITFEYVMLDGVNDSIADAKELVRLLKGIPAKINLIPFNPWPGAPYTCSDWEQIEKFAEVVNRAGYASPVRSPRGRDIMAACGQLKSASVKQRASLLRQAATVQWPPPQPSLFQGKGVFRDLQVHRLSPWKGEDRWGSISCKANCWQQRGNSAMTLLDTVMRWLALALAFCVSAFVSIVILFALGSLWAGEGIRMAAERGGDPIAWHASDIFGALFFTAAVLPAMTALPALLAALVGELFHIRSALYYTLAGGAVVAAIPLLAAAPEAAQAPPPAAAYMTIFAAAGFAGGFLYWLLAGRRA